MRSTAKLFFFRIRLVLFTTLACFLFLVSKNVLNYHLPQQVEILIDRPPVSDSSRKSRNPFRCYDDLDSVILKDFYRLDCTNLFLRNISLRDLDAKADVCEPFNESYGGDENRTLFSRIERDFKHFPGSITHTDIMNIEAACPECHHIQIIDGELFIVQRRTAVNFQTRSRSMKAMLKQVLDTFDSIGNLEMFIHLRK
jgi:hypothetical protein